MLYHSSYCGLFLFLLLTDVAARSTIDTLCRREVEMFVQRSMEKFVNEQIITPLNEKYKLRFDVDAVDTIVKSPRIHRAKTTTQNGNTYKSFHYELKKIESVVRFNVTKIEPRFFFQSPRELSTAVVDIAFTAKRAKIDMVFELTSQSKEDSSVQFRRFKTKVNMYHENDIENSMRIGIIKFAKNGLLQHFVGAHLEHQFVGMVTDPSRRPEICEDNALTCRCFPFLAIRLET